MTDSKLEVCIGDIRNGDQVLEACQGVDTVFHAVSVGPDWGVPSDYNAVNIRGTQHLIQACRTTGVAQLIYLSSTAVVFDGSDIQRGTEDTAQYPARYLDLYSSGRAAAERLVLAANGKTLRQPSVFQTRELLTCSLRPSNVFGPYDAHFIPKLIQQAKAGGVTHMIGDGGNVCDFTYVGTYYTIFALLLLLFV
jgi:sterol-4alpha-carboxylate 3-dehydrogenase (decarboxylating)